MDSILGMDKKQRKSISSLFKRHYKSLRDANDISENWFASTINVSLKKKTHTVTDQQYQQGMKEYRYTKALWKALKLWEVQ